MKTAKEKEWRKQYMKRYLKTPKGKAYAKHVPMEHLLIRKEETTRRSVNDDRVREDQSDKGDSLGVLGDKEGEGSEGSGPDFADLGRIHTGTEKEEED